MHDIHLYESESGWAVSVDGREQQFATRSEAFAAASAAARANSPSRVVRSAPPRPTTAPPPAARPPVVDRRRPRLRRLGGRGAPPVRGPLHGCGLRRLERRIALARQLVHRLEPTPGPRSTPSTGARPSQRRPLVAPTPLMAPPPARAAGWQPASWARLAGPSHLGRSVLVGPGDPAPPPWAECERIVVDAAALAGDPTCSAGSAAPT